MNLDFDGCQYVGMSSQFHLVIGHLRKSYDAVQVYEGQRSVCNIYTVVASNDKLNHMWRCTFWSPQHHHHALESWDPEHQEGRHTSWYDESLGVLFPSFPCKFFDVSRWMRLAVLAFKDHTCKINSKMLFFQKIKRNEKHEFITISHICWNFDSFW